MQITLRRIDESTIEVTEVTTPSVGVTSTNIYTIDQTIYLDNLNRDKNQAQDNATNLQTIIDSINQTIIDLGNI